VRVLGLTPRGYLAAIRADGGSAPVPLTSAR